MSSSTPISRRSRPWSSVRATARPMTQRHSPSVCLRRCTLSNIGVLPAMWSRIEADTRARSSGCTMRCQSGELMTSPSSKPSIAFQRGENQVWLLWAS